MQDLGSAVFLLVIGLLVFVFMGEPDVHDKFLASMDEGKTCEVVEDQDLNTEENE